MRKVRAPHSIRSIMMLSIAISIFAIAAIVLLVFRSNMLQALIRAENTHVTELSHVTEGIIDNAVSGIESTARSWASWDEGYEFVEGNYPDFYTINILDDSPLEKYKYDFLIIKDKYGADLVVQANYKNSDTEFELSQSFLTALNPISKAVIDSYDDVKAGKPGAKRSRSGFIMVEGQVYIISVQPIQNTLETKKPNGTFVFGVIADENYLRELTNLDTSGFSFAQAEESDLHQDIFELHGSDEIMLSRVLTDAFGKPVRFQILHPRAIYKEGISAINVLGIMLTASIGLVMFLLYMVINSQLIKRIIGISSGVGKVSSGMPLDDAQSGNVIELQTLSSAINDMVTRVESSTRKAEQFQSDLSTIENILNCIDSYIYVSDLETNEILFINDEMRRHFNIDEDISGIVCWKVFQEGYTKRCDFCPCIRLLEGEETVVWEKFNTLTKRYYHNTDRLIDWADGRRVHIQHSQDITEVKNAELSLKKQLRQQEMTTDLSRSLIDPGNLDETINGMLEKIGVEVGADRITLFRNSRVNAEFLYEWRNPDACISKMGGTVATGFVEDIYVRRDVFGNEIYYNLNDIPDFDDLVKKYDLDCKSVILFPIFIGERRWGSMSIEKCTEKKVWSQSEISLGSMLSGLLSNALNRIETERILQRLSSVVTSSSQIVLTVNRQNKMDYFNPALVTLSGYTEEELKQGGLELIFSEDAATRMIGTFIPQIIGAGTCNFEEKLISKSGETRLMSFSGFRIKGNEDTCGVIAKDITELRKLEKELISAKEQAEEGSKAKSNFLSRMSHEMRTPMNAIIGMTNIALSTKEYERREYCLEKIGDASKHLLGVINDILDMSKIEADKFEIYHAPFNFEKMLMNVVNVVNFRVEEKRQDITVKLDPKIPPVIISDEQRISQVVTNLLTNAVKFTEEEGSIVLEVRLKEKSGTELTLQFDVIDSGIGISPEHQAQLFQPFVQADGGISRKFGGTGLGLAISKQIVMLMGGEISIFSEEGKGSTFTFTIKAEEDVSNTQECRDDILYRKDLNIMVVDDSAETLENTALVAKSFGVTVSTAQSGAEALKLLDEKEYDILFVDWKMPEMNGIELTKKIIKNNSKPPIIIMISVAEWSEIEDEAIAAGVRSFLPKPVFASNFARCINGCFGEVKPEKADKQSTEGIFAGKCILLAEDVMINQEILIELLSQTGILVETASNGKEAFDMFAANPERYSLVLMDVQMPEVDGLEATRRIRASDIEGASRVPIIAMTANVFREDVERCLEAGMNEHLPKPIDQHLLIETLKKYIPE